MKNKEKIPLTKPSYTHKEQKALIDALLSGDTSGDSHFNKLSENKIKEILNISSEVLLTTSCTHALEMSALLIDAKKDDEIIMPSYTFVSTASAFYNYGAKPVFADIREDTLNIDENLIKDKISSKTKAIVPVHYAGVPCEMDSILKIAHENKLFLIEDNAHGFLSEYKGKKLGTFGDFSSLSFHESKNISCGEGGALIINNREFLEKAEIIRDKGTNRANFFKGLADKYTWQGTGSSFCISGILSSLLLSQLTRVNQIQNSRKIIWEKYYEKLKTWAEYNSIKLPFIPEHTEQSFHIFYLIMPTREKRDDFIDYCRKKNITASFHYIPLHLSPVGKNLGYKKGDFPITEDISQRLVRLPLFTDLNKQNLDYIVKTISRWE